MREFTLHNNTSEKKLALIKSGVRFYTIYQYIRKELTLMKGGVRFDTT